MSNGPTPTPPLFTLPHDFLFGVCNSPYHAEGGFNVPGGPHNHWWAWERDGISEPSGAANDFWSRYQDHIDVARRIGLNAFRLGFDWARVQPSFEGGVGPAPAFDPAAFDRYAEIVAALWAAGMEPVITLSHFVQPAWVGPSLWLHDELVEQFMTYARTTVREVNRRLLARGSKPVRFWVTFNEPVVAPTLTYLSGEHPHDPFRLGAASAVEAQDRLLAAHVRLYNELHNLYAEAGWGEPHVGFNNPAYSLYEYDKALYDLLRAREHGVGRGDLAAYLEGGRADFYATYNPLADRRFGVSGAARLHFERRKLEAQETYNPLAFSRTIEALYASARARVMDYVAINIYEPFLVATEYHMPEGKTPSIADPPRRPGWWDWTFDPDLYEAHLALYAQNTLGLPLYMLEASLGHKQTQFGPAEPRADGLTRGAYLRATLRAMARGLAQGYPLMGYLYWTLCDNYEWGSFTVRLGLLDFDYAAMTILETDGLGERTGDVYAQLIRAMRSGDARQLQTAFAPEGAPSVEELA